MLIAGRPADSIWANVFVGLTPAQRGGLPTLSLALARSVPVTGGEPTPRRHEIEWASWNSSSSW